MVERIFFDSSVLVAGLTSTELPRDDSRRLLSAIARKRIAESSTAWHCCLEFYAVATRLPEEFRLSPPTALDLLRTQIVARFSIHNLPQENQSDFLVNLEAQAIAGARIYDLHIAEIARSSGADTVVTNNRRHFLSLLQHGIRVLTAAELVEERGL